MPARTSKTTSTPKKTATKKSAPKKVAAKAVSSSQGPHVGERCPAFSMATTGGGTISLTSLKGQPFVLYFYPKDDTPGCTTEACDFRDNFKQLSKLGVAVFGVSKDSLAAHEKFSKKYSLNFPLATDADGIAEKFGCWVEKSMYGKKYMGMERSTFLVDASGKIAAVWRKVSVTGHVDAVLQAVKNLG